MVFNVRDAGVEHARRLEWILPDGFGGFAMGTVAGIPSRRYHGLLVRDLDGSLHRYALLRGFDEWVQVGNDWVPISTWDYGDVLHPDGVSRLVSFHKELNAVTHSYQVEGCSLRRRVERTPAGLIVQYQTDRRANIKVFPLISEQPLHGDYFESACPPSHQLLAEAAEFGEGAMHWAMSFARGEAFETGHWYRKFHYGVEAERGLNAWGDLYNPIEIRAEVRPDTPFEVSIPDRPGTGEPASGRYLARIGGRLGIIAGYPWFGEWARDTLIALPGLLLVPGRSEEAFEVLQGWIDRMHGGLVPNRAIEGSQDVEDNALDATLWLYRAGILALQQQPHSDFSVSLQQAFERTVKGFQNGLTHNIKVEDDGLLTQGEEGLQLTWMDAKVGDEVITPRRGKAIEINALWIHALQGMAQLGHSSRRAEYESMARNALESFEARFWNDSLGYYIDVVDPDDMALRPNQVIALALPIGLRRERVVRALASITDALLTPCGLRTLSPRDPAYRGRYEGSLNDRDRAYHQGTVWPWLLGFYVEAVLRHTGDVATARRCIESAEEMRWHLGVDGIAEVYDGDAPQRASGCPFQAWSEAEIARAKRLIEDAAIRPSTTSE